MNDPLDRLAEALKDRYVLEREVGAGGMATVYLARDLRHERQVAWAANRRNRPIPLKNTVLPCEASGACCRRRVAVSPVREASRIELELHLTAPGPNRSRCWAASRLARAISPSASNFEQQRQG